MRVVCCTYQHGDPTEHVERDEALRPSRRRRRRRGRGRPAAALGVVVAAWRGGAAGLQIHGDGGSRRVVAADELVAPHRLGSVPLPAARLRRRPCIGRSSAHEPRGKTKKEPSLPPAARGNTRSSSSYNKCVTRCDAMRHGRRPLT